MKVTSYPTGVRLPLNGTHVMRYANKVQSWLLIYEITALSCAYRVFVTWSTAHKPIEIHSCNYMSARSHDAFLG